MWTFKAKVANLSLYIGDKIVTFNRDWIYTTRDSKLANEIINKQYKEVELISKPTESPKKIVVEEPIVRVDNGDDPKEVLSRTRPTKKSSL